MILLGWLSRVNAKILKVWAKAERYTRVKWSDLNNT